MLTIRSIEEAIQNHEPVSYEVHDHTKHAAVAIVLRSTDVVTEALFILRASHDGDPWSGHMAFPGGHSEPEDQHLRRTAEREVHEEIGLDLVASGQFIGEIDSVRANPRGRNLDLIVTPFVYLLEDEGARFTPNHEVADILWGSLNDMHSGESLTTGGFEIQGEHHRYPGYEVGGQIVWGLTYRMLDQFFGMMDPNWDPAEEF